MNPLELALSACAVVPLALALVVLVGALLRHRRWLARADVAAPLPRGSLFERYRLDGLKALGGMAEIHRAVDRIDGTELVLKVARPVVLGDPDLLRRFAHEAEVLRRANELVPEGWTVGLRRHGRDPLTGRPFLALEPVPGRSLLELLDAGYRPTLAEIRAILGPVAAVLDRLHAAGIQHRDLSPDNIVVEWDGPRVRRVTLLDFGVAGGPGLAEPRGDGSVLGKAAYMSPEQCRGETPTASSDRYALGVVLYRLLTGETPFGDGAGDPLPVMHRHEHEPAPAPSAEVHPALAGLLRRALAKDPAERPESAAEFLAALDLAVGGPVARRAVAAQLGSQPQAGPGGSAAAHANLVDVGTGGH